MTDSASDDSVSSRHCVCLVVPNGSHRPTALARAVAHWHPDVEIGAIWCGDPHLRPTDPVRWWDVEALVPNWHDVLLTEEPIFAEWRAALAAVQALVASGASSVTVLWVGALAVLDDIAALWVPSPRFGLVPRITSALPDDGAFPDAQALADAGCFSAHVATFDSDSSDVIEWLSQRFADHTDTSVGRWLELAASLFGADECDDSRIGVGAWRWDTDRPALLDVPGYDATVPWVLDVAIGERTRINVVGHDDRGAALAAAADQLAGERCPLTAPGGIRLDDAIRRAARSSTTASPSPWADPAAFRDWLGERYWTELPVSRRDLADAFPRPTTSDAASFTTWSRRAAIDDDVSLLVPPLSSARAGFDRFGAVDDPRTDGLNLMGYLRRESSLGDVARRLASATEAAGVPTTLLAHERTASPLVPDPPRTSHRIDFATTVAVVNADQFATIELDHPELIAASRRMIGYWFWELEMIPPAMRAIFPMVDEIWAGSKFVVDAFAAVAPVPVRHVPIPVARPIASDRTRPSFAPLASLGDRFVFTVVFDHFSVTERKNPIGAIEAFKRAFAPGEGPVMVIKTMNGERRWPQHQHVLAAADGRDDIVVWDEHLSRADHMAFIAAVDSLVSLHRSEGLGLHLAEAMWLGTPTIATRYSGNLDFMDDECALLVDAALVPVEGGEGVYPVDARWADPDLDIAAAAMRRLVDEPQLRAHLSAAGRSKMEGQASLADTGRLIAELLQLDRTI